MLALLGLIDAVGIEQRIHEENDMQMTEMVALSNEGLLDDTALDSVTGGGWGKAVVTVAVEVGKAIVTGVIGSAVYDAIKPGK